MNRDDARPDAPNDDTKLDAAIRAARIGPTPDETAAARARAWAGLSSEAARSAHGCDAVRHELADFIAGRLSPDRTALVADHCRECVPCRRELLVLRDGPQAQVVEPPAPARGLVRRVLPYGIAAAVLLAAVTTFLVRPRLGHRAARVAQVDGQIVLADGGSGRLEEGAEIPPGRAVRTAKGSRAVVELPDGSRVEMNERAEIRFTESGEALTVDLARGDIIVAAAKRHERNLFVRTDDCSVAVKGTVFTVGHGLKGSRVGVLEGEVHVDEGGDLHVLKPGDQVSTSPDMGAEALSDQVAWSLSREKWTALLGEIDGAATQLAGEKIPPVIRYESRILDAMPARTVFYAAIPNGGSVARFAELVTQRVAGNPQLAQWWQGQVDASRSGSQHGPSLPEVLERLGRLSSAVGDEVVIAFVVPPGDTTGPPVPVVVTRLADEQGLRDALVGLPGEKASLISLDEAEKIVAAGRREMTLVLHSGYVLAGPSSVPLLQVAAGLDAPSASANAFLDALHAEYRKGTEFVLAADLASIVERSMAAHATHAAAAGDDPFARLMGAAGLDGIDRFLVTAGQDDPGSATLTFRDDRHGIASWLAEPAPMGSLDFVTPKASIVVAAVFRDPAVLLADLDQRLGPKGLREGIESFRADTGVDLIQDVAAPLGGEMAIALDGPILPKPSWKVVVEVYDQARLEQSIRQLVERAQAWAKEREQQGTVPAPTFSIADEDTTEGEARVLTLDTTTVHYAYRDGYLVACPSRQLLVGALEARRMGSIADSDRLRALLPKGADHVSLLAWQDLGSIVGEIGQAGGASLLPANAQALAASGPLMLHVRASDRALTLGLGSVSGGPGAQLAGLIRQAVAHSLAAQAAAAGGSVGYDDAPAPTDHAAPQRRSR